jgi:hypothetical protein
MREDILKAVGWRSRARSDVEGLKVVVMSIGLEKMERVLDDWQLPQ